MNYRNIFKIAFLLISSPAKAWEDISLQWDRQRVVSDFVYPMIGFCGLSFFIGSLFRLGWSTPRSFQLAMIECCGVAVALFGGFFLSAYLINSFSVKLFGLSDNLLRAEQFTGYALVITFFIDIVLGVFPVLNIFAFFLQLYVFYIVWVGAPIVMNVEAPKRLNFTAVASLIIIICPWLIQYVFNKLTFLLN